MTPSNIKSQIEKEIEYKTEELIGTNPEQEKYRDLFEDLRVLKAKLEGIKIGEENKVSLKEHQEILENKEQYQFEQGFLIGKKEGEQKAQALWDKLIAKGYPTFTDFMIPNEDLEEIKKEFSLR